jgi:hypothetical protein
MQIKIIKLQLKESKNREGSYIYIKTFEVENTVYMNIQCWINVWFNNKKFNFIYSFQLGSSFKLK